jgi:site-specific DNA recombinase
MSDIRVKRKLIVYPEEAEIVRQIYDYYITGMGGKAIAERLNHEGFQYRGKPWAKNRILDIIGDESYVGKYFFNKKDGKTNRLKPKEEWILIPVDPILDEVTWEKASKMKAARRPNSRGGNPAVTGAKTLLTGIAVCGLCGSNMCLETAKSGKYTYYNCANYFRKGKSSCPGQRIPAEKLETAILGHMANKLFTKPRVKAIIRAVHGELRQMDKRNESQRKSLRRQLDSVGVKLTRQFEAIESGNVDLSDVGERIRELKARREQVKERLEEITRPHTIPIGIYTDQSIESFQKTIKGLFFQGDRLMTKRYLKLFIEKIIIKLPRVEILGRMDAILGVLINKNAVRTDGVLTAMDNWLPGTDSNRRQGG